MKVSQTPLADVLLVEVDVRRDDRGHFAETWNAKRYEDAGIPARFVQENVSFSHRGVLRGLHFQQPFAQSKLVQVLKGGVFDVAVDLRKKSPTFGTWWGTDLTPENGRQLYIPEGFAHGFLATKEDTVFHYQCSEFYHPEAEHTIVWNDPDLNIQWPVDHPTLSPKDAAAQKFSGWLKEAESKSV